MIRKIFILFLSFGLWLACSNEIELYTTGNPIPIVYCLLNPDSDVQYVRLSKTFMTDKSTENLGPVRDSTVWDSAMEVYVEKFGSDGDSEELIYFKESVLQPKDSGLFPDNNYQLFRADFTPEIGVSYVLYIHFKNPDRMVSARTVIMDLPELIDPSNVLYRSLTFDSLATMYVRWMPANHGGLYQGFFRFHYAELIGNSRQNLTIDFPTPVYSGLEADMVMEKQLNPQNFFKYLAANLEVKPDVKRIATSIEYIFYSTGEDLALWYNTLNDGNSSQTSIFEYSNIEGGKGIFSSWIVQRVPNIPLSSVSIRNLMTNPFTKDLGFID